MVTAIATEHDLPIYWHVENGNLKRVKSAQQEFDNLQDPTEQELVSNIEQEQQRWLHLYGEHGALGFNKWGTKRIDPSNSPRHQWSLKQIDTLSVTHSDVQINDAEELRRQKLAYYQEVLKPKINSLLQS